MGRAEHAEDLQGEEEDASSVKATSTPERDHGARRAMSQWDATKLASIFWANFSPSLRNPAKHSRSHQ